MCTVLPLKQAGFYKDYLQQFASIHLCAGTEMRNVKRGEKWATLLCRNKNEAAGISERE